MEPHSLVQQSDLVAIFGGIAFCFGSIGCMMLSVHLARLSDINGMKSLLKLAGGFTLASCCLLAATTYCVVHRCERYCQQVAKIAPLVQADEIASGSRQPDIRIRTRSGDLVEWKRPQSTHVEATFL